MDKQSQKILLKDPRQMINYNDINGIPMEFLLKFVKYHGLSFFNRDVKFPYELQLKAVKNRGSSIQYIENPSEEIKLAAIKKGDAIQYIQNPTEEMKLEAIKNDQFAIEHIKDPSKHLQLEAVKLYGYTIEYIEKYIGKFDIESLIPELNTIKPKNPEYIVESVLNFINNFDKIYNYNITDYQYYDNIFYFLLSNLDKAVIELKINIKKYNETTKNIIETVKYFQRNPNVKSQVAALTHALNSKEYNNQFITKDYLMNRSYHSLKRK